MPVVAVKNGLPRVVEFGFALFAALSRTRPFASCAHVGGLALSLTVMNSGNRGQPAIHPPRATNSTAQESVSNGGLAEWALIAIEPTADPLTIHLRGSDSFSRAGGSEVQVPCRTPILNTVARPLGIAVVDGCTT